MAKQRPSLGVSASPISTYVAPVAAASAGLELYDQQTVNLALQFSEAFQNLSLTAANFAGSLKAESNKEELQKGLDLVNSSQKTYQQLVEDGQISPTENPWLAIGAQQGSGMMEGMKARAHFMETYQKRAAEDPKFYDSLDSFNALASQYAQNVGTSLKNSPYQSRAFFEAFNPFVSSMSLKHQENVAKTAENKVLMGVGASVAQLTQDIKSQDPIVRSEAMQAFRNSIDEMGQMGVSRTRVNEAVVENMIALMETTDQLDQVQAIYESLDLGTGPVKNTAFAKALYASRAANIERNRQKLTAERDGKWLDYIEENASQWAERGWSRKQVIADVRANPVWQSLSVQEQQSKMDHALGRYERAMSGWEKQKEQSISEVLDGQMSRDLLEDLTTVQNLDQWRSQRIETLKTTLRAVGITGDAADSTVLKHTRDLNSAIRQHKAVMEEQKIEEIRTLSRELADGTASVDLFGWGPRADGETKGGGWLGPLTNSKGETVTEYSIEIDGVNMPLLVPTLTPAETQQVLNSTVTGERPSEAIVEKAFAHAQARIAEGKSPFASFAESPMDLMTDGAYGSAALAYFEAELSKRGIPEDTRRTEVGNLSRALNRNIETQQANRLNRMSSTVKAANDREFQQQFTDWINNGTQPPNFAAGRSRIDDLMKQQGVDLSTETATKVRNLEAQRLLQQIQDTRQNVAQNFTGKTLSPTDQDRPGEREQKAVIRQRLLASEMMLSQTYENRLLAGQIGQSMQTLLTPGTTEAEASVGAFEDLLFAFAFAKQAGVEPRYILPSGDVGKAMEEEIQFSLGQLEMGQSPQDIAKDISARRYFGSQSRMTPEQMMDPLAYLSVRGGAPETREITSQFMLVRDRMGINNPDAQPFMTAEFRKNYLEALNVSRDHKTALRSATDKMSKDYVVIENSVLPLEALPPNVSPQAAPGYLQNLLETRYPGQKATLVVVARDDIDGTPLMAVRTPNGESVPGAVGLLKPKDLALTSTDLMNEGATTRRIREREMRRERELTSMRPKF